MEASRLMTFYLPMFQCCTLHVVVNDTWSFWERSKICWLEGWTAMQRQWSHQNYCHPMISSFFWHHKFWNLAFKSGVWFCNELAITFKKAAPSEKRLPGYKGPESSTEARKLFFRLLKCGRLLANKLAMEVWHVWIYMLCGSRRGDTRRWPLESVLHWAHILGLCF